MFLILVVIFFCFGFCWSLIVFVAFLLAFYKLFPYIPFALLFWYKNDLKNGFTPSSKICVPEPPAIFCAGFFGFISCNLAHTGQSLIQNIVLNCLSNLFFAFKRARPLCALLLLASEVLLYFDTTFIHKEIRIEKKFSSWITLVGARFITSGFWWSEEWGEGIFQSSIYFQKGCPKRRKRVRALIVFLKSDKTVRWF